MLQKTLFGAFLAVVAIGIGLLIATRDGAQAAPSTPSGKHFTLNLIANSTKNANMDNAGGSVIFVPLECGKKGDVTADCNESDGVVGDADCRINLRMGDFGVLDKNCTDGVAGFQLPDPCAADNEPGTTTCTETAYSVFIALAGKPGGGMDMETCFHDTASNTDFCSLENVVRMRTNGKPNWSNVSKCLLSAFADTTADGVDNPTRTFIFDPDVSAYWWEYDNWGNRIAKLRFYPVTTAITDPGVSC